MNNIKKEKTIEDYWLRRLSGDLPKLLLPTLPDMENKEEKRKAQLQFDIPEPITAKLEKISAGSEIALFILVLAAVNIVLNRYTGEDDIVIGTVTPREENVKERLVLCRNRVSGKTTLKETINQVKQKVLEDFNYADYSFGLIYQKLLNQNNSDSLDVFHMAFIYDALQNKSKSLQQFELLFVLSGSKDHRFLQVDYNANRYSEEIIRRFCRNWVSIFDNVEEKFDRPISKLEIVCREEQQELYNFNRTTASYPEHKTIHQLFEEQVRRTPENTAIVDTDTDAVTGGVRRISYRELNEKANQLAGVLRQKGVTKGSIVGIMEKPSIEMVVEMLAILKAGGAYLPIDPGAPKNRVVSMLDDCDASLLITRSDIVKNYSYSTLQGIKNRKAVPVFTPTRKQITNLDSLPIPDRSMVNYEKYNHYIGQVMAKNIISLQTARGCPFNCAYCSEIWPSKHVFRTAENIFEELQIYYNMGVRRFSIFDDIFNVNIKNGKRLFQLIIDNGLDVQLFFPNGMRGDLLDKEYIDLAVEAGLSATAMALETASPRLQRLIKKNLNLEKFRENIEYFCEKHPQVILELFTMHGFPSETEEEAHMTMDFIKSLKWVHFPYIFILKIYPGTEMADLAVQHGVYREDILRCEDMAFHELSPTSPFDPRFTKQYQMDFLNDYFLSKERLLHVLPFQAKVLTEDEIIQKYDSYLPFNIETVEDILELAGIQAEELQMDTFQEEEAFNVPDLNQKLREYFPVHKPSENALRVLLLDLTQYFTHDTDMLYDVVEPPLGTMYIMTYLKEQLGEKINGKILKSRIDFDSYEELKSQLDEFNPDVIGVRSLTFYRDFFHKTIGLVRQWGFEGPIIAGGPYATRNPDTLIQDRNIDLLVISEGEWTFCDIISKIIKSGGQLPAEEELRTIDGIVFLPRAAGGARGLLLLDTLEKIISQKSVKNLEPTIQSLDMAYIVFTSGSTGKPKGVIIDHRNVVNVLTWFARTYNVQSDMRVIQLTNYTFDPSVEQIFSTLLHGAELYIGKRELTADKETFRKFVKENQIHILNFIPGALKHMLEDEEPLESLRTVISGGEKLEEDWKNQIIKKGYPLYNQYGPTETTIDALMEKCSEARVTLGQPIANVQCYIFQPNNTLAPIGVKGELYIGGAGVARGYLNNPDLTSDKFPVGRGGLAPLFVGGRTYRTGDLVRWLPNGTIEFIGRMDHQIKIRGLRIELGEIEAHLQAHSKIKEAVVNPVKVDQETSDTQLCGYVVSDLELTPTELRDYLAMELPEYMIPSYFVRLEKLPLNPNGKLDRLALPEPADTTTTRQAIEYVAPETDIEKKLAEIWEGVLGKEKVGVNENFFGLGGDSVKSIQILSRLNKAGYKVEMTDIFQYPTISQLAPWVTELERAADQSSVKGIIPLTPIQKHFFLNHKTDPHHFSQAVLLYFRQGFEEAAVREIFTRIQAHHDTLRMTYKIEEGGAVIQTNQGLEMPLSLEVNDLRGQETAVETLEKKANDIQASIDLENGPLMKLGLFHLDDGDRLLIVAHHLVIDSISWRILFEDINSLYNQYKENKRGDTFELPKKTDSFKVWAETLTEYANSEFLLEEKTWWKQLENTHVSPLPVDFEIPNEIDAHQLSFSLDEKETHQLVTNVNDAFGTDINDILLTGLGLALKETFRLDRFLIGLEGHEREEIFKPVNVTRTVGCFTTLFPMVLDLSYAENLARQIKEVKDHLHRLPNRGLGYGILRYLTPSEHKGDIEFIHKPRIGFNYLGQFDADLGGKSFEISAESPGQTANPYNRQGFELEVSGIISRNRLSISIAYNRKQYKTHTTETLMDHFKTKLKQVITFCSEREEKELTPSDMDYKELTVEELDSFFD